MEETIMDGRKKLVVSIVAIFILVLTLLGITYAYFVTRIKGNTEEKSVSIKTAKLELFYSDGNGTIEPVGPIIPGASIDSKTFSVENRGNEAIDTYGVYLENIINEFERKEDVTLDLTCKEYDVKTDTVLGNCNGLTDYVFPKNSSMIVENKIDVGVRQEYELTVKYIENGLDQSDDMNKKLSGKVQIYDNNDVVDLLGSISGTEAGDYVELIGTEVKISNIIDNSYKFVGIKPGTYTINVKNIIEGVETLKGSYTLTVEKAASESIQDGKVSITEATKQINLNIDSIEENLNTNIILY